MLSIRQELAKGTLWTAVGRYSRYALQVGIMAILARLLSPSDFGVMGMVLIYIGFVDLVAEFGLSTTVVQKRYLTDAGLSTVFWLSIIIALAFVVISLLAAPIIETALSFSGLSTVIRVMSVNLVLSGLTVVPYGQLQQRLAFRELSIIEISSTVVSGIVSIVLAVGGLGYWALVVQDISAKVCRLVGFLYYTGWLPQLKIEKNVVRDVFSFSSHVLGFRAINYWARNADNLLVGSTLGAVQLGLYNQAYKLMMYPVKMLTDVVAPTIQPVFAAIQDEPHRMAPAYLQMVGIMAFLTFPLGVFLTLFAGPVIRILWGDKWVDSIPIFEVLAILTMFQPVVSTSGSVFLARGRAKLLFRLGIVNSLFMITGIVVGLNFGLVGVAVGYAFSYLSLVFPLTMYNLAKTLDVDPRKMFSVFLKPTVTALVLAAVLSGFKALVIAWNDLGLLGGGASITALVGVLSLYSVHRELVLSTTKRLIAKLM